MEPELLPALELRSIARSYDEGAAKLDIFKDLSLVVNPGEIVALVGPSGAGKSSLLHIAGLLEAPTGGEVFIAGQNCTELDDRARTRVRRIGIGFVYQFHHLLPEFTAVFRAGNASVSPSRAPLPTGLCCCWPMNPPAIWTPKPPTTCMASFCG